MQFCEGMIYLWLKGWRSRGCWSWCCGAVAAGLRELQNGNFGRLYLANALAVSNEILHGVASLLVLLAFKISFDSDGYSPFERSFCRRSWSKVFGCRSEGSCCWRRVGCGLRMLQLLVGVSPDRPMLLTCGKENGKQPRWIRKAADSLWSEAKSWDPVDLMSATLHLAVSVGRSEIFLNF